MTQQEKLENRLKELQEQQRNAEINFHQITGAITLVMQQIEEEKKSKQESKKK